MIRRAVLATASLLFVAVLSIAAPRGATGQVSEATPGYPVGHPGLFTPGQPLHCSGVDRMTPAEAAPVLEALGYDVTWQVEDRDRLTSGQTREPPKSGFIIEGIVHGRAMVLVVEVGSRATPAKVAPCDGPR